MENLKEALEKLISSYARDEKEAAIKAAKEEAKRECFAAFVLDLKDLLPKCNE